MDIFGLFKPDVEKMKAKKDVKGLINALKFKKVSDVRKSAAFALGDIGDTRAVEPLTQALRDEEGDVRRGAAWALEKIGDARTVEPLIQALKDEVSAVRENAAQALGKKKDGRAVEPLIQSLKDEEKGVRLRAAESLGLIGKPAVEPLIQVLNDEVSDVRNSAAFALGETGDARAVQPLMQIVKDSPDLLGVENAISALKKIDEQAFAQAVDILVQNAIVGNDDLRNMAQRVLRYMRNMAEIDIIYLFGRPSANEVVTEAISICTRIREQEEKRVVEDLVEMIPRILPYMMMHRLYLEDDWYERGIKEIDPRALDEQTARKVLKGILSEFLELANKNLSDENLKKAVEEVLETYIIRGQGGVYGICPVGSVDLISKPEARRVLMGLPITSQEDPRRDNDPTTSTYFDYGDSRAIYNLDEASRNIYSYWVHKGSEETSRNCEVRETHWGKELTMGKGYTYPDHSGRWEGVSVVRLDDNSFLFYGSALKYHSFTH